MRSPAPGRPPLPRLLLPATLGTLVLTAAHHVYGGVIYDTPWRIHGAYVSGMVAIVAIALWLAYQRGGPRLHRLAGWALVITALTVAAIIGAYEGAYNHAVKNVLYFGGASDTLLTNLFPPPTYELPNDLIFELSGVAQVIPGAVAAMAALQLVRDLATGLGVIGSRP